MAELQAAKPQEAKMLPTLRLTGVTVNAMALIAPGAFLWITFVVQAGYAYPSGMSMWAGILAALALAFATAVSYSELAKLYPGAGSSYLFAEQAFLNHSKNFRFARMAKFVLGWGSHLYYWVYPGAMAATIGIMIGYIVGIFFPDTINSGTPGPVFMALVAIIAAFGISYIAYSGVQASTVTNFAINTIQILALLFFTVLAIMYRVGHPEGSMGMALDGTKKVLHYAFSGDAPAHPGAWSVVAPHGFNSVMLQATIAIFLLCGFESVTSLGEEARNPKKDIARGVLLSLLIQGLFCYMFEYFWGELLYEQRLQHGRRQGFRGADRLHNGDNRKHAAGGTWAGLHGYRSRHRVSGSDRYDVGLYQHRRARHLCYGPRQRGAGAFRYPARRKPHAASDHLDAGGDLGGVRGNRRPLFLRRRLSSRR